MGKCEITLLKTDRRRRERVGREHVLTSVGAVHGGGGGVSIRSRRSAYHDDNPRRNVVRRTWTVSLVRERRRRRAGPANNGAPSHGTGRTTTSEDDNVIRYYYCRVRGVEGRNVETEGYRFRQNHRRRWLCEDTLYSAAACRGNKNRMSA